MLHIHVYSGKGQGSTRLYLYIIIYHTCTCTYMFTDKYCIYQCYIHVSQRDHSPANSGYQGSSLSLKHGLHVLASLTPYIQLH